MTQRENRTSRLVAAIRSGDRAAVNAALRDGADIEEADMHGYAGLPLRTACFSGNLEIIRDLIEQGADLNAASSDGPFAPLRIAQRRNYHDVYSLLLLLGAVVPDDLNTRQSAIELDAPILEFTPPESPPQPSHALIDTATPMELTFPEIRAPQFDGDSDFGDQTRLLSLDPMLLDTDPPLELEPTADRYTTRRDRG